MNGDLEKYRKDFTIVRETAAQVIKDFNVAGFEITFSANELLAYEELKQQIEVVLSELFRNHLSKFQNLLYKIDIEERQLKKNLRDTDPSLYTSIIADLILQREFNKVLTRRFYSK